MSLPPEDPVAEAEATERALREQVGDLVRAKTRAERESERLRVRGERPGADPSLGELSASYTAQAANLADEVERARAALRAHEVELERLRAAQ